MKRSPQTRNTVERIAPNPTQDRSRWHAEIGSLRQLADSPDLDQVVGRFIDGLAIDPQFHLDSHPETDPLLSKVAAASIGRLTGGHPACECRLLRCAGTGLVHGICSAGGYVVLALLFPDDNVGVLSALFCPPGIKPWNARIRFQQRSVHAAHTLN